MDHLSEIPPQRMVQARGSGVISAQDILPDHQRDLIGMLAYKVLRIEKWTSERAAHREHLERLAEAHGYVGAWLDYRDYHLTIVGQSYQYDVPLGKRGILAQFAGRRVRLVCNYSGPFRRWVRIGVPAAGAAQIGAGIVLLENRNGLLPLAPSKQVYVPRFDVATVRDAGFVVTDGSAQDRAPVPSSTDAMLIKMQVRNPGPRTYSSKDPATGGQPIGSATPLADPRTGKPQSTLGAQEPCVYEPDKLSFAEAPDGCLDSGPIFGVEFPSESNLHAPSDQARAISWTITPSLDVTKATMRVIGDRSQIVIFI